MVIGLMVEMVMMVWQCKCGYVGNGNCNCFNRGSSNGDDGNNHNGGKKYTNRNIVS